MSLLSVIKGDGVSKLRFYFSYVVRLSFLGKVFESAQDICGVVANKARLDVISVYFFDYSAEKPSQADQEVVV